MLTSAGFNLPVVGFVSEVIPQYTPRGNVMATQLTSRIRVFAMPLIASIALCASIYAHAGPGGGGHGGGGGGHAGGFRGGFGGRGGYGGWRGGWHGGYGGWRGGWHGGYGRWRGGYGYGGWGWPGYGLFLSTLPFYYSTLWWDGVPYYYADDSYYLWNASVGQYQSVDPPPEVVNQVTTTLDLFAYPKSGQTTEQQEQDKRECRTWAAHQTGFGATPSESANAASDTGAAGSATKRQAYLRAQGACLEARGYSVK
jgi:hypothetical protein